MFLFWMLIALCLSSKAQSHIEVNGKDTSAVIPIQQIRIINARYIELKACQEENDSLDSQIRTCTRLTNNLRSSIMELKQANMLSASIVTDKDKVIDLYCQQLKKSARKNKILKLERNIAAIACLILIGKIIIFH